MQTEFINKIEGKLKNYYKHVEFFKQNLNKLTRVIVTRSVGLKPPVSYLLESDYFSRQKNDLKV